MVPNDPGRNLRDALVAAYGPYVRRVLGARGLDGVPGMEDALEAGRSWLDVALGELLSRSFSEQARGPLEVFQEATRFPTGALEAAGVAAPDRDAAAAAALPGDRYGLAPASSADLGEEAWAAHLAWGAAKARAFRPTIGLLSADLMDRSKIEPVVQAAGFALVVWRAAEAIAAPARPALALVDLSHREADDAIRMLAADGVKVVAFGPHVDDLALVRARSLGAADALPRSAFFRDLSGLLPTVV